MLGCALQARALEAALDGAALAGFQFHIGEPLDGGRDAEVPGGGISQIVVSSWRLIAVRFSCCSFCSSGVIGFLSGFEDEGVVFQQGDWIGGQFVEQRVAEPQGWLRTARRLLLAQDVGDIVGAESAGRGGLFDGARPRPPDRTDGSVQQFARSGGAASDPYRPCRADKPPRARANTGHRAIQEPLLRLRAARRGPLFGQYFFETLGSEGLAAPPRARIADDFLYAIIDGDGTENRL